MFSNFVNSSKIERPVQVHQGARMTRRHIAPRGFARFGLSVLVAMALAVLGTSLGSRPASAADYMYVSLENRTIVRYDVSLATSVLVKASETVFATSSEVPFGLAFDTAGNLFVANGDASTITKFDSSGNQVGGDFVGPGQGLNGPAGLAFDAGGILYVSNVNGDSITRYSPSGEYIGGAPLLTIAQGVDIPYSLAFDKTGNLYVANYNASTITRYDASNNWARTDFVTAAQGLDGPIALAFDAAGNLYAANQNIGTITRYDSAGNRLGTNFVGLGQGLNIPFGIAFDRQGNLYATNYGNYTISKYDSTGALQFVWGTGARPIGVAFVPEPSTYVLATLATGLMALIARRRKVAGKC